MARSIALLVPSEHRRLYDLAYQVSHGRASLATRQTLTSQVRAHLAAAAEVITERAAPDPDTPDCTTALRQTNERLAELVDEIGSSDGSEARDKALELLSRLPQHCELEEALVTKTAEQIDVRLLRILGGQFTRVRDAQLREQAHLAPPVPRGLDLPAAALYEQARRVGIPGRSNMSRDELIAALSHDKRSVQV